MACGTPVAASNAGSLPEILGDVGSFFDPQNPKQMLNLIKKILSDDNMRKQMSLKGLIRAKQFSWNRAATDLISVFHDLGAE
jgi:glycosyltransferase involved in cell wall biosynthesis